MRLGRRKTCDEGPFKLKLCDNNSCVPYSQPCPCAINEFRCKDDTCIPRSYLCNGRTDCPGSSDEINCTIKHPGGLPFHVIMGIIGGGVVFITLVSLVVVIVGKQKLKNRRNSSNSGKEPLKSECDHTTDSQKTPPTDSRPLMQKQHCVPVHSYTPKRNSRIQVYNNMLSSVEIDFGEGLLCTSTPKQPIRQHRKPCIFTESPIKDARKPSIFTESPIKDASASDLSKNLNMSLFLPIT